MKLIIELSNGTVYGVKKKDRFTWTTLDELKEAIKRGKPLQAELEEIKADFEEIKGLRDNPYNNKTEYSVSMKELREVFDKRIKELKGETNG